MAEEILDPLRRTVEGVATGVGDVVGGIGKGISSAVGGVGDAVGGLLGGFQNMPADDRMALINTLGRTGAALMALGQPGYNPKLRQQAIMALGNVPGQVATDRFKSAQARLMQTQLKQKIAAIESLNKITQMQKTPEGITALSKMLNLSEGVVGNTPAETLMEISKAITIKRATMSPEQRAMEEAYRRSGLVGGGQVPAPKSDGVQTTAGGLPSPQTGDTTVLAPDQTQSQAPPSIDDRLMQIWSKNPALFRKNLKEAAEARMKLEESKDPALYAGKQAVAKKEAELAAKAPGALASGEALAKTLNKLLNHPGLYYVTGRIYGSAQKPYATYVVGEKGEAARAALSLIEQGEGGAFLSAFETLKGGGQITVEEGKKATAAISRLSRTDVSTEDYKKAIKDLAEVVAKGVKRTREIGLKYNTLKNEPSDGPARITTEAQYNSLPSGSLYVGPDGSTRRKR